MIAIPSIPPEFLSSLEINGIKGRKLQLPARRKGSLPIVLIYGHHSSLERMYSTAQAFNEHGAVTIPDLPGFGGMPALTTIGKAPTITNLADYMATFIRQEFPNGEKFILEGLSLGFAIAVRMLQRHPDLQVQVAHLVSIVGFAHQDDAVMAPARRKKLARLARLLARRPSASIFSGVFLQKPIIGSIYHLRARTHPKMKGFTWKERQDLIDFETILWKTNEVRTYFTTMAEMLEIDLTDVKIPMPVEHIGTANDQYIDNQKVAMHLALIFTEVHTHEAHLPNHVPTVLEDVAAAKALIPESLLHIFGETHKY